MIILVGTIILFLMYWIIGEFFNPWEDFIDECKKEEKQ